MPPKRMFAVRSMNKLLKLLSPEFAETAATRVIVAMLNLTMTAGAVDMAEYKRLLASSIWRPNEIFSPVLAVTLERRVIVDKSYLTIFAGDVLVPK